MFVTSIFYDFVFQFYVHTLISLKTAKFKKYITGVIQGHAVFSSFTEGRIINLSLLILRHFRHTPKCFDVRSFFKNLLSQIKPKRIEPPYPPSRLPHLMDKVVARIHL